MNKCLRDRSARHCKKISCIENLAPICVTMVLLLTSFRAFGTEPDTNCLKARGMIVAVDQPIVSSQIAALIKKINVREGEYFERGDLLIEFDDMLIQAQREKTTAELEAARVTLENKLKLAQLESIGTLAVSLAEAEVKSKTAEVKISDITLSRCSITAPFNGRVVNIFVNEHESAAPNQKLFELVSSDHLEVAVLAPSTWTSWLTPGLPFKIEFDGGKNTISAHIVTIGAVIDPISKMIKIRGRLDTNPKSLLPGMTTTVFFTSPQKKILRTVEAQ